MSGQTVAIENNSNKDMTGEKMSKVVTVDNPYFIKEENEEVIERKENEAALAELQAKLEHYQRLSVMSGSIKRWVLVMNAIIIPIVIGITLSVFVGSSKSKPSLEDYAAAVSTKDKAIND